jgi:hypothetical protein
MGRVKEILISEFEEVFQRNWEPVVLVGDALPGFTKSIPACCIIASGEISFSGLYSSQRTRGRLVGGIDVYRHSPDDPVPLNKDWYAVVASGDNPSVLLVDGPLKDSEHWLGEIPQRYARAELVGSPKRTKE